MTEVILVHGGSGDAREAAIAAAAAAAASATAADAAARAAGSARSAPGAADSNSIRTGAAILEGLAGGNDALQELEASAVMKVIRVAPGCPCCTGNLTMRITLNRVLRDKPALLFLSIANASHKARVRAFLQDAQYREHLELGPELDCS